MSSIKQAAEEMLLQTISPFWKGLRDEENGGFYGYMDFDLKLDKKAEKGCILNSRILWFFSEAAMLTGRADLAEDARHAYQFFLKNCYDEANGGVYWSCDYTGKPQDTTKHTYNQGFAIYALSAYYRLTKDPVALAYAKKIFHLIEQHCTDSEGWLLFYHGVTGTCNGFVYSIGGAILDKDEPSKVLYRCGNFLLTPEKWYEERGFVPNVCFPCATLQDADTGRIALYYGCADSYVGLAFTTVDEVVDYIKTHDNAGPTDHEVGIR